jgi:hypothetical protein
MPEVDDWKVFDMPERATLSNDGGLKAFLDSARASSVRLSAKAARKLDTPTLQMLLVASRSWRNHALGFELANVPQWLSQQLDCLGVKDKDLKRKVAE